MKVSEDPARPERATETARSDSCAHYFELDPHKGVVVCELPAGHDEKWHRNRFAGFEWSGRVLWLLPPQMCHAA